MSLGEVLDGDRMAYSLYNLEFKRDANGASLCRTTLTEKNVASLKEAIEELYYFEFVVDDIPIRGFVGHFEETGMAPFHEHKVYLWTHHHFNVYYNGGQIISVNITTKDHAPTDLGGFSGSKDIEFTYSVKWIPTTMTLEDRELMMRVGKAWIPRTSEIHWLAVCNSLVLDFLLVGFVVLIMTRVLKSDFARYNLSSEDEKPELDVLDQEEYGWKIIHGDVFRVPKNLSLFSAFIGVGTQFLVTITGIILLALMGFFNVHRHGAMNSAAVILYALTSSVAGFTSAGIYRKLSAASPTHAVGATRTWVWTINLTACVFAVPFFLVWSVNNSIAWAMGATQAVPASTVILLFALLLFVGYPLTVVGGILGKNFVSPFEAPCRIKNIAREIPPVPLYRSWMAHLIVGGFLPFSAISVELYYIFSTLFGRDHYTLYGILLLVFGILISVTACITVALTYFQLAAEDYRWWWRSLFAGGSTGGFVLLYSMFFYFYRSNMTGLLQTLEFFGYAFIVCYIFFLTLGAISFFSSFQFVCFIYRNIKMD